jgi:NTP pyrophosphatase (non-canonical NTP hydrolase)
MEQKLRANDHKGGWDDDTLGALFARLLEEVEELRAGIDLRSGSCIIDEAADVANFCMMLADRVHE